MEDLSEKLIGKTRLDDGCEIFRYSSVGSTNIVAKQLAREHPGNNFWVVSDVQTTGKGSRGRNWVSPVGNLYASYVVQTSVEPKHAATLTFVASLALHDVLIDLTDPTKVTLKWPNDILLDGKKLSGILLEYVSGTDKHSIGKAIVGFGVNCRSFPQDVDYAATSLHENNIELSPADLQLRLHRKFTELFKLWNHGEGFFKIRTQWLRYAANIGKSITVKLPNDTLSGIFDHIDEDGALILICENGQRHKVSVGDIFLN